MTTFACPKPIGDIATSRGPSGRTKGKTLLKAPAARRLRKVSSKSHEQRAADAVQAGKKQKAKRTVQVPSWNPTDIPLVYIGNLDPSVTDGDLVKFLEHHRCTPIANLSIRMTQGCNVRCGTVLPAGVKTERDTRYAAVVFRDFSSATRALVRLNQREFKGGKQLVVTRSVLDLPEAQAMIRQHEEATQQAPPRPAPDRRYARLIEAPTEPTVDAVPKAQIHGFTLANTVV